MPDGRPLPLPIVYAGAGAGHAPVVKAYTAETGDLRFAITAYEPSFQGGVRVGTGDFNGDGIPDVVTAPGPDHAPVIKVFDSKTGDQLSGPLGSFLAYAPSVDGGVYIAAADVDGDRKPDIITSAVTAFGPRVKVFSGANGGLIADFFVSGMSSANGGLTVAAADVTGDGKAEVVLGSGLGGDGWVRTYDPLTGVVVSGPLGNFRAFGNDYGGGVYVGSDALAADVDGDGTLDLAVGTRGPLAQARVRVFSGSTGAVLHDFLPFGSGVVGGARVGLAYVTDDAHADMVVGTGPGNVGMVRVFDGVTGNQLPAPVGEYAPFGADTVGVFVAASNDPSGQIYGDFTAYVGTSTGPINLGDMLGDNGNTDPNQFTVSIDWGDGTNSFGWVVYIGDDGMGQQQFLIKGQNTYQLPSDEMSPYTVTVQVSDANGLQVEGTVNATVYSPPPPSPTNIKADIDIDGFNETTEDNPGGLVVMRAENNNAPRKKIIIQQIPGWTGDVLFTEVSGETNIKVYDATAGGTQITFNGTDNKYANANLPKTLYVQGDLYSSDMRDTVLNAAPIIVNPNERGFADTVSFTVLWVDVDVSFTGSVRYGNNDKADEYNNATTAKTYGLGLQTYVVGTTNWWGWGYEARGLVKPITFNYPGNDLKLERDIQHRWYKDSNPLGATTDFSAVIPPGNDTGPAAWRDDNPLDSDPLGEIYDLDMPGIYIVTSPQNEIRRIRFNFKEFASITIDGTKIRASNIFDGYVRFSIKQTTAPSGSTWIIANDVVGDNDAGTGTTKITWDLM